MATSIVRNRTIVKGPSCLRKGASGKKKRSPEGLRRKGWTGSAFFGRNTAMHKEKQAGRQQHPGKIEDDVVGIKAAAENRLEQLDDNDQQQTGPQGVPPGFVAPRERIEDAEGQVHQDVSQVFPGKAGKEVGDQVELPVKPVVDDAAGLVVEEKIPEASDDFDQKGEAQKTCQIGNKEGGPDFPGGGRSLVPGKAADAVEKSRQQGKGKHLQEITRVGIKKEVLSGHNSLP